MLSELKKAMTVGLGDAGYTIKVDSGIQVPEVTSEDLILYFGLPAVIILTGVCYAVFKCLKKCDKLRNLLVNLINSIFLGGIMRSIFCLYLVLCAKSDID